MMHIAVQRIVEACKVGPQVTVRFVLDEGCFYLFTFSCYPQCNDVQQ